MMEVIRLIHEESIKLLKLQGVEFETGLTIEEITKIEDIYNKISEESKRILNDDFTNIQGIFKLEKS